MTRDLLLLEVFLVLPKATHNLQFALLQSAIRLAILQLILHQLMSLPVEEQMLFQYSFVHPLTSNQSMLNWHLLVKTNHQTQRATQEEIRGKGRIRYPHSRG